MFEEIWDKVQFQPYCGIGPLIEVKSTQKSQVVKPEVATKR